MLGRIFIFLTVLQLQKVFAGLFQRIGLKHFCTLKFIKRYGSKLFLRWEVAIGLQGRKRVLIFIVSRLSTSDSSTKHIDLMITFQGR